MQHPQEPVIVEDADVIDEHAEIAKMQVGEKKTILTSKSSKSRSKSVFFVKILFKIVSKFKNSKKFKNFQKFQNSKNSKIENYSKNSKFRKFSKII